VHLGFASGVVKLYVFNDGNRNFGTLSTAAGSQTILANGGDGLADVFYSSSPDGLSTNLIVDVNDDGVLGADDLVIAFDGNVDFTTADFLASTFTVVRGTNGADTINGTSGGDTIYGAGGNDVIGGLAGSDFLYGRTATTRSTAVSAATN
jgi:Ca2+-binding RTX toxin-like protein